MQDRHLHIISFNVPYPADYGGVIDVFYKIKSLHSLGIKIHLHCFDYGRGVQKKLNEVTTSVTYYKRNTSRLKFLSKLPYIVATRDSVLLLDNLKNDNFPILFEGIHSCFFLNHPDLTNRIRIVRTHNIENEYYTNLANVERNLFKRIYFNSEARKLTKFESILSSSTAIASISKNDLNYFSSRYKDVAHISAFHPHLSVDIKFGIGAYALYHGNLGVGENNMAALYLVNQIFNDIDVPLVIAGNMASVELINAISEKSNVSLITNTSTEEIQKLICNAQINILPTFQATGIKLKLLAALYSGRHCLVNTPMVSDTGLEGLCEIADSAGLMKEKISELMFLPFDQSQFEQRKKILESDFSNEHQVEKLIDLIYNEKLL